MADPLDSSRRRTGRSDESSSRTSAFAAGKRRPVDRRKPDHRAVFLAEISRTLFDSLDCEETLTTVTSLAMPELGAWCIIDMLTPNGGIVRTSVTHPDRSFADLTHELKAHYPPNAQDILGAGRIIGTQQPELVREISDDTLSASARDKRQLGILRALVVRSYMVLPLKARDRLIGAITFIGADPELRYTPTDLLFAEDLAGRIAMAMDNARLYKEAQSAKEEAVDAVARASLADRAKTDFLATMSHELRTPLNAIAGYAELLELGMRGPITDQQREAIIRIRRAERHLLGIVNDILMFAKTETGRIPLVLEDTPVAAAIEAVRFIVEPMLTACEIQLSVVGCEETMSVVADCDRFNQILVNLLSNAIKFSDKGGAITVACEVREHLVAIVVKDEGRGIHDENLEAIFEPFVQLSSGLTRTADGSGLGLAIGRELARLMGGDVTVESELGHGSSFTLTLPMSPPSVPVL